jgi:hypothetical protein
MRETVDKSTIERWRRLESRDVLVAVADYAKRDADFVPAKDPHTQRWHVVTGRREFELLLTGPKFWDASLGAGGGGAIDLVCHIFECDFTCAVRKLRSLGM